MLQKVDLRCPDSNSGQLMIIVPPVLVVIQNEIALLLVPLSPHCAVSPQRSFHGRNEGRCLEGEKRQENDRIGEGSSD